MLQIYYTNCDLYIFEHLIMKENVKWNIKLTPFINQHIISIVLQNQDADQTELFAFYMIHIS